MVKMDLVNNLPRGVVKANSLPKVILANSLLMVLLVNSLLMVLLVNNLVLVGLIKVIHVKMDQVKEEHLAIVRVKIKEVHLVMVKDKIKEVHLLMVKDKVREVHLVMVKDNSLEATRAKVAKKVVPTKTDLIKVKEVHKVAVALRFK